MPMVRRSFGNLWWGFLLKGLFAIGFGVLAFAWPDPTVPGVIAGFGVYCLMDGIVSLVITVGTDRWTAGLMLGFVNVAFGLMMLVWPGASSVSPMYAMGIWAVAKGGAELGAAAQLHRIVENEWLLTLGGVASIGFGALLLVRPGANPLAVLWIVGGFATIFGLLLSVLGLKLREITKALEETSLSTAS